MLRTAAAVLQSCGAFLLVPLDPLVRRLARDAVDLCQRADALALLVFLNQFVSLVLHSVFLPRHASYRGLPPGFPEHSPLCHLCLPTVLLPISSDRTDTPTGGREWAEEPSLG